MMVVMKASGMKNDINIDDCLPRTKKFDCYWESDGYCQHTRNCFEKCIKNKACAYYKPMILGVKQ